MQDTLGFDVAPVHRMTHRRILLAEERERRMAAHFEGRFGEAAREVIQAVRKDHPPFLGPSRPEDVLGPDGPGGDCDPHQFLEEAARAQVAREAAALAAVLERFGDEAEVEARLCSYDHGWEVGERVAGARGLNGVSPEEGFDLLADHFPHGTACRPGLRLLSSSEDEAVWEVFDPEVREIWVEAGASPCLMSHLNAFWCKGFGEALRGDGNDGLEFRAGTGMSEGAPHDEGRYIRPKPTRT